jgi:hypothetical protein
MHRVDLFVRLLRVVSEAMCVGCKTIKSVSCEALKPNVSAAAKDTTQFDIDYIITCFFFCRNAFVRVVLGPTVAAMAPDVRNRRRCPAKKNAPNEFAPNFFSCQLWSCVWCLKTSDFNCGLVG